MARHQDAVRLTVRAMPGRVALVRRTARTFAERHRVARPYDVELCVCEAATNAVVHAYRGRSPGPLHLIGRVDAGFVHLQVVDEGRGFAPRPDSPGLGAGLEVIARATAACAIDAREPAGTVVSMSFARLASVVQDEDLDGDVGLLEVGAEKHLHRATGG